MKQWMLVVGFLVFGGLLEVGQPRSAESKERRVSSSSVKAPRSRTGSGNWIVHETENFRICCTKGVDPAVIGATCETLREELSRKWLAEPFEWSSRCSIVFHPTLNSYLQSVGRGGGQTLGCSSITVDRGKVISRRIDVRGDRANALREVLPHEMTHAVIADFFADQVLPGWVDEGVAVLADTSQKQGRHRGDLMHAFQRQASIPLPVFLENEGNPGEEQRAAFYGQSASLVNFLVSRGTPSDFLAFVRRASQHGYDTALRDAYHIQDTVHLERLWKLHVVELASKSKSRSKTVSVSTGRR